MTLRLETMTMDYVRYRKVIKFQDKIDNAKRKELLRVYLHAPTLPKLQAIRALLFEMKNSLNHCTDSKEQCLQAIRSNLISRFSFLNPNSIKSWFRQFHPSPLPSFHPSILPSFHPSILSVSSA